MLTFGSHSGIISGIIFFLPHYYLQLFDIFWSSLPIITSSHDRSFFFHLFFLLHFFCCGFPSALLFFSICCRKIDDGVINQKWSGVEEPCCGSPMKPPRPLFPLGPSVFNKLTICTGSKFLDRIFQSVVLFMFTTFASVERANSDQIMVLC